MARECGRPKCCGGYRAQSSGRWISCAEREAAAACRIAWDRRFGKTTPQRILDIDQEAPRGS